MSLPENASNAPSGLCSRSERMRSPGSLMPVPQPWLCLWLVGTWAWATGTRFGPWDSAGQGQLRSQGVWVRLRLYLRAGFCYQSMAFRIITAWFLSPWTCRKSRFETSHFMKPTGWGCSSFPHFPFPIWRASPPWCVVIWGVFCVSHPARELSLWNCGFPKTFQLFQGVRWDFHKNLSRAGFGLECSRLTQGVN